MGLCFAVMEEFVTDLHYYGWNVNYREEFGMGP